jgi:hypothetical protein
LKRPRLILALLLLCASLATPAHAAGPLCGTGGQLAPAGFQQLTVSSTAVALTVPTDAIYAVGIVECNGINIRDDGTSPTASVGMPYGVSSLPQTFTICGSAALTQTRLIRRSSDSVVNVS